MKTSTIVFGGSALLALVLALAARIDVPQTVAATESVGQSRQFDDSWNALQTSIIPKTASLREEPKLVQTVKIEPESEVIPEILMTPKSRFKRVEKRDVCQRHGMHKVQRGRSWRCR